jgi:hypothetical protein
MGERNDTNIAYVASEGNVRQVRAHGRISPQVSGLRWPVWPAGIVETLPVSGLRSARDRDRRPGFESAGLQPREIVSRPRVIWVCPGEGRSGPSVSIGRSGPSAPIGRTGIPGSSLLHRVAFLDAPPEPGRSRAPSCAGRGGDYLPGAARPVGDGVEIMWMPGSREPVRRVWCAARRSSCRRLRPGIAR